MGMKITFKGVLLSFVELVWDVDLVLQVLRSDLADVEVHQMRVVPVDLEKLVLSQIGI